ncbi:hypothetical protein DNTS_034663 [Danionella cerebrum]|uniref:Fibronectin type-III domain-containing protein n=1 Tax=Danionella cerebrum TaxID=2873325 RepID=A0A553N3K3_9TELE|nr:hypothetical protein DNTS_034663 [Danionella translucida]
MASVWLLLALWICDNSLIKVTEASSCANIHTPSTMVLAGSPLSVSCSIEKGCAQIKGKDFSVEWKINGQSVPRNFTHQESTWTYSVFIPNLQNTVSEILCYMCVNDNGCQIVDGVTVKTGLPNGRLDTWLKLKDQEAELHWKPSPQFKANGWNLSYIVESKVPKVTLCETRESFCYFNITKQSKKIYLRARNAVGSSSDNEIPVRLYRKSGLNNLLANFQANPQSETSLFVEWERDEFSNVTEYVLEWRELCEGDAAPLFFTIIKKDEINTTLSGLRPYKPYSISMYPKYAKGIGHPTTLLAYSREKAPSMAPELKIEESHHSHVKIHWDEIPLEQRNGIIQGYTVFFWHEMDEIQDGIEMVLFIIPASVGFSILIIIIVFTCFGKHKRVKMCLWPIIPDPANSSIKRLATSDSLQAMPPFTEDKDHVLVYLSHFSLLDPSEKEPFKGGCLKENQWTLDASPVDGHCSETSQCFDSEKDIPSIPYATVVFSSPYQSNSSSPPAYTRSESTQPLLGADEPTSPPAYENVPVISGVSSPFSAFPPGNTQSEESQELWEEFPMLRSLEIREADTM